MFQLSKVEIFMNLPKLILWYLLVQGEDVAIDEGIVVEDIINALIVKNG